MTDGHSGEHIWTGDRPTTVRCAFMFCTAKPTAADIKRLATEVRVSRAMRIAIVFGC
jgi:hypothetical protein